MGRHRVHQVLIKGRVGLEAALRWPPCKKAADAAKGRIYATTRRAKARESAVQGRREALGRHGKVDCQRVKHGYRKRGLEPTSFGLSSLQGTVVGQQLKYRGIEMSTQTECASIFG